MFQTKNDVLNDIDRKLVYATNESFGRGSYFSEIKLLMKNENDLVITDSENLVTKIMNLNGELYQYELEISDTVFETNEGLLKPYLGVVKKTGLDETIIREEGLHDVTVFRGKLIFSINGKIYEEGNDVHLNKNNYALKLHGHEKNIFYTVEKKDGCLVKSVLDDKSYKFKQTYVGLISSRGKVFIYAENRDALTQRVSGIIKSLDEQTAFFSVHPFDAVFGSKNYVFASTKDTFSNKYVIQEMNTSEIIVESDKRITAISMLND